MSIHIVIGKNFGDEGKGLATDYFALKSLQRERSCLVIRHNGGAQAGHTVDLRDRRFVFHELSSGSFRHADTYWSDTFLPDLFLLSDEAEAFCRTAGFVPNVFADVNARCTTIIDILINQALESGRGDDRHGSCGMGIDETVRRSDAGYAVFLKDVLSLDLSGFTDRLMSVRKEYVPVRLAQLGIGHADLGGYDELLRDDNVICNWARKAHDNIRYITPASNDLLREYDDIVFEGAQGLLLDEMNKEYAPHLTTSRTGLTNPLRIIREVFPESEKTAEAVYVTRSYVTRHGNGPLPNECEMFFADETNQPNEWQGTLRFAKHGDRSEFVRAMERDIADNGFAGRSTVFMTHLNEMECDHAAYYRSYSRYSEDVISDPV